MANIKNRKASFDYEIIDRYTAGIALSGCEVKSLRGGNANINEAFCIVDNGEIILKNAYIKEYIVNDHSGYDSLRDRKLLLNKKEILKIAKDSQLPGYTIVPLLIFFNQKGYAKINIAVCRGKHNYDKRETIKARDIEREMKRIQ
jgi:SsrA-binding protein